MYSSFSALISVRFLGSSDPCVPKSSPVNMRVSEISNFHSFVDKTTVIFIVDTYENP